MKFQPIIDWWMLLPFILAGLGLVGKQLWTLRKKPKQLLFPWIRRGLLVLVLLIMALGPSFPISTSSPGIRNLDVLFVVDTTASMGAMDYNGTKLRIEGVRNDMLAIGKSLSGAHFSIITFDSKAYPTLPFTEDYATFASTAGALERELYNTSSGSSIDKSIDLTTRILKDRKTLYPDRNALLFYIGDGEQTDQAKVKDFTTLSTLVKGGAILGYGTASGAKIQKYTGISTKSKADASDYIQTIDPKSKKAVDAISRLDENNLKKIASQTKLSYQNRNTPAASIQGVLDISKVKLLVEQAKNITLYLNFYWVVAIPFTALLFWEWRIVLLHLLETRQESTKKTRKKSTKKRGDHE